MGKMPQNSSAWKCPAETEKIDEKSGMEDVT